MACACRCDLRTENQEKETAQASAIKNAAKPKSAGRKHAPGKNTCGLSSSRHDYTTVRRSSSEFTETFLCLSLSLCQCSLAAPASFACLTLCQTHLLFVVHMSSHVAPLPPVVKGPRYSISKSAPTADRLLFAPCILPAENGVPLGGSYKVQKVPLKLSFVILRFPCFFSYLSCLF